MSRPLAAATALALAAGTACVVPGDTPFAPLDDTPPSVLDTIPEAGVEGVPVTVRPEIRFSEPMDWDAITGDHVTLRSGPVTAEATVDFSRIAFRTLVVVPSEPLVPDVEWTLTLSGEVTDAFFNPLGEDFVLRFRTAAEPEPFILVDSDPEDGAEDVPVDAAIVLELSVPVAGTSLTRTRFRLRTEDDGAVGYGLEADGRFVTLTPTRELEPGAGYRVVVEAETTAVTDQRLDDPVTVAFTTAPATAEE